MGTYFFLSDSDLVTYSLVLHQSADIIYGNRILDMMIFARVFRLHAATSSGSYVSYNVVIFYLYLWYGDLWVKFLHNFKSRSAFQQYMCAHKAEFDWTFYFIFSKLIKLYLILQVNQDQFKTRTFTFLYFYMLLFYAYKLDTHYTNWHN